MGEFGARSNKSNESCQYEFAFWGSGRFARPDCGDSKEDGEIGDLWNLLIKNKKVFKIIAVLLLILWNLILSVGIIFLHQRINNDIKTSGEINVAQMNLINDLNQRIKKLEKK